MDKVVNIEKATVISKRLREEGRTIVLAGGCFDMLHEGHKYFLTKASQGGDVLMVTLESDENVRRLKGEGRPVSTQSTRAKHLASLSLVDYVIPLPPIEGDKEYFDLVRNVSPSTIATTEGDPKLSKKRKQAKETAAKLLVVPKLKGHSTTKILGRKAKVFIAIDIPSELKEALAPVSRLLGGKEEKLHLTLVFLGLLNRERLGEVKDVMKEVASKIKPFSLKPTAHLLGFPGLLNARVIWLPLEGELEKLSNLVDLLKRHLKRVALSFEKRSFTAHVTLGRFGRNVSQKRKREVAKKVRECLPKDPPPFTVVKLTLYESEPSRSGSVYKVLSYAYFSH